MVLSVAGDADMIEYRTGDILTTDAEALVNTVNCVGIMGRGIALQFKNAFPANFKAYAAACNRGEVQPGRMFVFETGTLGNPKYIINFPTKRHWRGKSRMEDIDTGLVALAREIRERRHPLDRRSAARQWAGRPELARCACAHRGGAARLPRRGDRRLRAQRRTRSDGHGADPAAQR